MSGDLTPDTLRDLLRDLQRRQELMERRRQYRGTGNGNGSSGSSDYLLPSEVLAGENVNVDRESFPGSVVISSTGGGGGGLAQEYEVEVGPVQPTDPLNELWVNTLAEAPPAEGGSVALTYGKWVWKWAGSSDETPEPGVCLGGTDHGDIVFSLTDMDGIDHSSSLAMLNFGDVIYTEWGATYATGDADVKHVVAFDSGGDWYAVTCDGNGINGGVNDDDILTIAWTMQVKTPYPSFQWEGWYSDEQEMLDYFMGYEGWWATIGNPATPASVTSIMFTDMDLSGRATSAFANQIQAGDRITMSADAWGWGTGTQFVLRATATGPAVTDTWGQTRSHLVPVTGATVQNASKNQYKKHSVMSLGGGGGGGGMQSRQTTTITTSSLVSGASATGTVALAKSYRIIRLATDRPARVRLYTTAAKRDADAPRAAGVLPTGDHGLVVDFVTTPSDLDWDTSPVIDGSDGKAAPDGSIPYTITNLSGSAGTVAATLHWIATEG